MGRRRIAVVGGGISGLTAAHILQGANEVTLYESDCRLGGHAQTHQFTDSEGKPFSVDSGFITFSPRSYPYLTRLFEELRVPSIPTYFSFGIGCNGCGLEYLVSTNMRALYPRVKLKDGSKYLALLMQIPAFNRIARRLARSDAEEPFDSLEDVLKRCRFTPYFIQHYVVPLVSSLWSCSPELVATYPAHYVAKYLHRHGLLSVHSSNGWRTVSGGSREYVTRLARTLTDVRLSMPVEGVRRSAAEIEVMTAAGSAERYDAVVMATPANISLRLLVDPTAAERRVLGAFSYSRNEVTIHTDSSILNSRRQARGSWNYRLAACAADPGGAQSTYYMNLLQNLGTAEDCFVTLNGRSLLRDETVLAEVTYDHPIDNASSVTARLSLSSLNTAHTVFAGSYHGWSSHEDGCFSGVQAAMSLGARW